MTLGEIAAQAATSGECELTKFAFSCIHFVVHPSTGRRVVLERTGKKYSATG